MNRLTKVVCRSCTLLKLLSTTRVARYSYKSPYNVEKLYPNSRVDYSRTTFKQENKEEFSGNIPLDQVTISHCRSSGPGGQNVNKVNTKVEIRFHVASAEWIPQWVRTNILDREKTRITKDGYLILTSDKTRTQMLNQANCLDRLRTLIRHSAKKAYEPSPEDMEVIKQKKEATRKSMLREKKNHSLKKQSRQAPDMHSL